MSALPPVSGGSPVKLATVSTSSDDSASKDANAFKQLLASANQDQLSSEKAVQDLITGKNDNVQQVVMQVVKSEMSFQLFTEVRNQIIESYNELMRMQF